MAINYSELKQDKGNIREQFLRVIKIGTNMF